MGPPTAAMISQRRRAKQIERYLVDDSDEHTPFKTALTNQRSIIMSWIGLAIDFLLDARSSNQGTETRAQTDDEFLRLSPGVCGADIIETLKEKTDRFNLQLKEILRGLLSATVTSWVFNEHHVSMQRDLFSQTGCSQAFERQLNQGMSFQWKVSFEVIC